MRKRKLASHVRTLGRAIRAGNRQPTNSLRMAEAIAMLAECARQPARVRAYNRAHAKGPKYKAYVRKLT